MRRAMLALLVLVVLTAAACGGGGKDDDKNDSSAATTTSILTRGTEASGSGGSFSGVSKKCQDAAAAYGNALASVSQAIGGQAKDFETSSKAFEAFAEQAPSEIKKDMKTVADALAEYLKDLKDAGIDTSSGNSGKPPTPAQMSKLQSAAQALQESDYTAASQRVQQWFAKECS